MLCCNERCHERKADTKIYIQLTQQAKSFRQALLTVSRATSALASALEDCSRVKGCDTASDGLMALSGLKHMMGAHQQLMVSTEASAEPVHQESHPEFQTSARATRSIESSRYLFWRS